MKKYLYMLMMSVFATVPVIAETVDGAPSDGYYEPDMIYSGAATNDNLGAYEGTVDATAEYDINKYPISAGYYLQKDSTEATQ
nr:hypothetical protein [Candidatus Enterousia merdequi]